MKTYSYTIFTLLFAVLMIGCASPVEVQKDESVNFSNFKTYSWVLTHTGEDASKERAMAYADISVRNAANRALTALGWREVEQNPDVLVSYDVLVERGTQRTSDPVYSQSYYRSYFNPYTRRWHTIYYPSQFLGYETYDVPVRESVISISMMEAKSDKLVWQGWTTEKLNGPRLTTDELTLAVNNIFRKFNTN